MVEHAPAVGDARAPALTAHRLESEWHMRPAENENWVLDIADRIRAKQPIEDSRVEVKSECPANHARAARRLAGDCNTSGGEPALWVIGLDEDRGIIGTDRSRRRSPGGTGRAAETDAAPTRTAQKRQAKAKRKSRSKRSKR